MTGFAIIPVKSTKQLQLEAKIASDAQNQQPIIIALASLVKRRWESAYMAKRPLEESMIKSVYQRRGEYDPAALANIRAGGGSEIFIMLTSVKCRSATSWLRDALLGTGEDKPWRLGLTPDATLPPDIEQYMQQAFNDQIARLTQGEQLKPYELAEMQSELKDEVLRAARDEASKRVARMESKMEDQLVEGGLIDELSLFIDDIATFPYAAMKGPVVRKLKTLKWDGNQLAPSEELKPQWERIDPFMLYWAPWVSDINDGYVIERHRMTRDELYGLIGVDGYSEEGIRTVLSEFDRGGLHEWLWVDQAKNNAEGKHPMALRESDKDLIEALQLWDNVQGSLLIEWGMDEKDVPDAQASYPCEVWLIGTTVIKSVLNYDPLGRKPYYLTSYEKTPGGVAGNGVADLAKDSQGMVNSAGRALANNMGISSGPQVAINIDRIPAGGDITQLYPWQIHQFKSPDYNDNSQPISFFQPDSHAQELMAVMERFAERADEDTGIPKFMSGTPTGGVGRTSSGLSMLISNAGKGIKQVIGNIDKDVMVPLIERLYHYNLRYSQDPELIGDINIIAQGAMSLVVKEAEAVRQQEFLQLVLQSPVAQQIVGMTGTAELLRTVAKNLRGDVDKIVPPDDAVKLQQKQQQDQQNQMRQAALQQAGMPETENIQYQRDSGGQVVSALKTRQKQVAPILPPQGQPQQGGSQAPGPQPPQGDQQIPNQQPQSLQADGAQQGGRDSNFVSNRLQGVGHGS